MNEPNVQPPAASTAGAMLRSAREKQGLHIAALAATIKITVQKLEALESDRYQDLPDATFTRALALTVCRALKLDPAAVLERLPQGGATGLAQATGGLNMPFRDRPGRSEPNDGLSTRRPLIWASLLILVAAALLYLLPPHWWQAIWPEEAALAPLATTVIGAAEPGASANAAAAPVPEAASAPAAAEAPEAVASAGAEASVVVMHSVPPGASAPLDSPGGIAVLRVTDSSWVEVIDAKGQTLVSRTLQPGENVGLDGALPFKVKIGNAQGAELSFRSQPVNLGPFTRDNVARLELK